MAAACFYDGKMSLQWPITIQGMDVEYHLCAVRLCSALQQARSHVWT